jgi:hypothetical protein
MREREGGWRERERERERETEREIAAILLTVCNYRKAANGSSAPVTLGYSAKGWHSAVQVASVVAAVAQQEDVAFISLATGVAVVLGLRLFLSTLFLVSRRARALLHEGFRGFPIHKVALRGNMVRRSL